MTLGVTVVGDVGHCCLLWGGGGILVNVVGILWLAGGHTVWCIKYVPTVHCRWHSRGDCMVGIYTGIEFGLVLLIMEPLQLCQFFLQQK